MGTVTEPELFGGGPDNVTVTQWVIVTVLPCWPVMGMTAEDEVGRGGIWASVVGVGDAKLMVMTVRGDDVDSDTGVISVNS